MFRLLERPGLLVAPGPDLGPGHHDFADWFEHLPTSNRVAVFVAAGLGFAAGFLLMIWQGSLLDAFL